MQRPFLITLMCDFIEGSGSLVVDSDSSKVHLKRFLAKCVGIPYVELSQIGLLVLAASPEDLISVKPRKWFPDEINADAIANSLASDDKVSLVESDVKILAGSMSQFRRKHLKPAQRVYIALHAIGRPAHYSKITDVHNSLFPSPLVTEHNVHAILSREQYGVVWIGVRGTFALKEWGYQHPSNTLFKTVAEIVEKKYKVTRRPVPLTIIIAEIGRYRKLVKLPSLVIAAHFNPRLQRVSKDSFIPKKSDNNVQDEIPADQLDKILQSFQEGS